MTHKQAIIFCIGRELLEGLVLDRNANFMAGQLSDLGYRVRSIHVLDDVEEEIVPALRSALSLEPCCIFTSGGMGPGHDDVTRECVAKALDLPLHLDERAREMLAKSYRRLAARGVVADPELNETRLSMARVPEGSVCSENPIGTAPSVHLVAGSTSLFLLPGVPEEMQRMFLLHVVPALVAEGPGLHKAARHILYPGRDESAISRMLADLSRRHHGIRYKARSQGSDGKTTMRITLFGEHVDERELNGLLERAEADLRARLGLEMSSPPGAAEGSSAAGR